MDLTPVLVLLVSSGSFLVSGYKDTVFLAAVQGDFGGAVFLNRHDQRLREEVCAPSQSLSTGNRLRKKESSGLPQDHIYFND
jgi:hypothetical protein